MIHFGFLNSCYFTTVCEHSSFFYQNQQYSSSEFVLLSFIGDRRSIWSQRPV